MALNGSRSQPDSLEGYDETATFPQLQDDENDHHPDPPHRRPHSSGGQYVTIRNPVTTASEEGIFMEYIPVSFNWIRAWIRVLLVLVLALLFDVIVLTFHVVRDDPSSADSLSAWHPLPAFDQVLTKIAFGSCASQEMPQPYWDTLASYAPDLLLLMGDNVYGVCSTNACPELTEAYETLGQHPSFQGAKSTLSIVATLDDGDYGVDDATGLNLYKRVAKAQFLDFFDIHDERRGRVDDGVYTSYEWGTNGRRVQVLILDTRFHRSPLLPSDEPNTPGKEVYMPDYHNTSKRMMSEEQWAWLEQQLLKPNIDIRLIVSSIQVLQDASGFDCWRHLPLERDRLVQMVQKASPSLILILSGDRHVGAFYEYDGVYEITASSWTHSIPYGAFSDCTDAATCDEADARRMDDFVRVNNFGSLEIDWETRVATVALRRAETSARHEIMIHDKTSDAGEVLQERQYKIS